MAKKSKVFKLSILSKYKKDGARQSNSSTVNLDKPNRRFQGRKKGQEGYLVVKSCQEMAKNEITNYKQPYRAW